MSLGRALPTPPHSLLWREDAGKAATTLGTIRSRHHSFVINSPFTDKQPQRLLRPDRLVGIPQWRSGVGAPKTRSPYTLHHKLSQGVVRRTRVENTYAN